MKTIAIDFGTDFSEVAHITDSGAIEVIPNLDGRLKTRSIVSLASTKPVVGEAAIPDLILNPEYVAQRYKRYMGKNTESGKPIPLLTDPNGREWTAVDLAAATLKFLKESAESYLGQTIKAAVITVPAYFDAAARDNTKAAAKIAGFTHVKLEDEPVAAATHYGLEKAHDENISVVDYGGGTLDVTGIESRDRNVKAIVTEGDAELGGSNYDEAILGLMCEEAKNKDIEISAEKDLATFYQNLDRARDGKEMLSRRDEVTLVVEAEGQRIPIKFTRKMLREVGCPFDERFTKCCRKLRKQLDSQDKKNHRVLLVGGSSRLPHVREMVQEVFGIEPSHDADPDFVIVKGAAILAAVHFGDKAQTIAVGEHYYLAEDISVQKVAAHAICVAAHKRGEEDDGQEYNVQIVPAGVTLPYEFEERFAPLWPGQSSVVVKIVQGEPGALSKNCTILREFRVPIKSASKDMDRIKHKGCYTDEGLLEMTVVDDLLNKPIDVSFTYEAGLSDAEIDEKREQLKKDME